MHNGVSISHLLPEFSVRVTSVQLSNLQKKKQEEAHRVSIREHLIFLQERLIGLRFLPAEVELPKEEARKLSPSRLWGPPLPMLSTAKSVISADAVKGNMDKQCGDVAFWDFTLFQCSGYGEVL